MHAVKLNIQNFRLADDEVVDVERFDFNDFLDFCKLEISPDSEFEMESCRDVVRLIFECSVTSGNPPNPVV